MINKLLIANRGEIARRIIRTANQMGLTTVALYTSVEESAPWVTEAHEALAFSNDDLAGSWLNADTIVEMALNNEVDAIHPGYGFLSENADFAKKVEDAGLIFVGPESKSIAAMGNKLNASAIAKEAGVPVQTSYRGAIEELEGLENELTYPVLIKAAAGGGGKGMKKVYKAGAFKSSLEQTAREAKAYFGNPEVYVERLLTKARHIEVQIIGDGKGQAIHLGERDCSLQRRHQKVIEEAPAAILTVEQREKVTEFAVQLARQMHYRSAGTVEFLLDDDGKFWFLEMNTRIQVEHPVTEAVTGLDIVRLQLQIANGQPLTLQQDDVQFSGHAIEARLYAEKPAHDFLPAAGPVHHLSFPDHKWLRVDATIKNSGIASAEYDPMLAKVIVHGATRDEAIRRLRTAIMETRLAGIEHNLHYLLSIVSEGFFEANDLHTRMLEEEFQYNAQLEPDMDILAAFVLISSQPDTKSKENAWQKGFFRQVIPNLQIKSGNQVYDIELCNLSNGFRMKFKDKVLNIRTKLLNDNLIRYEVNNILKTRLYFKLDKQVWIFNDGQTFHMQQLLPQSGKNISGSTNQKLMRLEAPMYGKILQIIANQGRKIKAGDTLMVLEAMKMENHLQATGDAVVKSVLVKEGEQVSDGQILMEFE